MITAPCPTYEFASLKLSSGATLKSLSQVLRANGFRLLQDRFRVVAVRLH